MTDQTPTPAQPVVKRFTVAASIIQHLIDAQADTLEKALMEGVMNSIDAGATQVDVTIDRQGFTVRDNGKGFKDIAEVDAYFGTFGFDHTTAEEAGKRTYGRFGIGRGQMWKFASTVWHTGPLLLDVNTRERGLDYIVTAAPADAGGTLITGTFYQKGRSAPGFRRGGVVAPARQGGGAEASLCAKLNQQCPHALTTAGNVPSTFRGGDGHRKHHA